MENCSDSFNFFIRAIICCACADSDDPLIGGDYVSVDYVTELTWQATEGRCTGSASILGLGNDRCWDRRWARSHV